MPSSNRWSETARRVRATLRRLPRDETGSASLEFITVGLVMLVPVVYLIVTIASIQSGSLGVEGAARQAARVFIDAPDSAAAVAKAQRAISYTLADYGFDAGDADVTITCHPNPDDCLTRSGSVTVTIDMVVPLPLIPPLFGAELPPSVPVTASSTQQVSRFAEMG